MMKAISTDTRDLLWPRQRLHNPCKLSYAPKVHLLCKEFRAIKPSELNSEHGCEDSHAVRLLAIGYEETSGQCEICSSCHSSSRGIDRPCSLCMQVVLNRSSC